MKQKIKTALSVSLVTLGFGLSAQAEVDPSFYVDTHRAVPISQFLTEMKQTGKLDELKPLIEAGLKNYVADPELRTEINARILGYINAGDFAALDHYPKIPLSQVNNLRTLMSSSTSNASTKPLDYQPIKGQLVDLLGACDSAIPVPEPISNSSLTYGHFTNAHLTACEVDRSIKMANILNGLSVAGSTVTYLNKDYHSPSELIGAFMADHHPSQITDERVYANFLSYNWGDVEIIWPAWLDTGMTLNSGEELTIPMGHSQYVWEISVPDSSGDPRNDVKASVSFFLGMNGTGFFPNVEVRPKWTGHKVVNTITNPAQVKKSLDVARSYLLRIILEGKTVVKHDNMPVLGYGYLGVCNDSVAAIEVATQVQNVVLPFPLLRAAALDTEETPLNNTLDNAMRSLPKDGDQQLQRADTLKRILNMIPYEDIRQTNLISTEFQNLMLKAQAESLSVQ
jgi:hypothetical protein